MNEIDKSNRSSSEIINKSIRQYYQEKIQKEVVPLVK